MLLIKLFFLLLLGNCSKIININTNFKDEHCPENLKKEFHQFLIDQTTENMEDIIKVNPFITEAKYGRENLDFLQIAALNGKYDSFLFLMHHGFSPRNLTNQGEPIIILAAKGNNTHILKYLLNHYSFNSILDANERKLYDINSSTPEDGVTPLMIAIFNLNYEMVELLLENGADVNKRSYTRSNSLHALAVAKWKKGYQKENIPRIFKLLEEKGVNFLAQDEDIINPFQLSIIEKNEEVIREFLKIKALKDKNIGLNQKDLEGKNSFYLACRYLKKALILEFLSLPELEDCFTLKKRNSLYALISNFDSEVFEKIKDRFGYKLTKDEINKLLEHARMKEKKYSSNNKIKEAIIYLENLLNKAE